ncbi:MAG: hypothetical protein VYB59_13490 [Pseudomonadota bacterium]|nr:hypothetical protein [Pseudomonadota bacterium]
MPRFLRFAERHGKFDVRFISHDYSPDYSEHCYDMAISTGVPECAETLSVMRLVAECGGSVCRLDVLPEGKRLAARSFVEARKRVQMHGRIGSRWSAMKTSIPVEVSNMNTLTLCCRPRYRGSV